MKTAVSVLKRAVFTASLTVSFGLAYLQLFCDSCDFDILHVTE